MAEVTVSEGKSLEKLEQEITCGVCQEHYEEPKILPCLHYYCKQCVLGLALKAGINKPFSCPECRHEATLPEGGVDEMKTAFFVNRLKSTVSTMEIAHGKVEMKCEACLEEPRDKAEAFCRQCAMFICKDCIKSHKRTRVLSNHQIASLEDLKEGRCSLAAETNVSTTTCPDHDEPMAIYCRDCNSLICRDCIMKDHKEHNFEFCKKAARTTKKEILSDLESLKEMAATVSHAMKDIETAKKEIEDQVASVATQIHTTFMKLHEVLKEHEKQLLEQARKLAQDKLDHLTVQEKNLSLTGAEIQSVVEYTEQCVRHCTDNEVMSMQVEMRSRIQRETEKHGKVTTQPVEEADIGVEVASPDALQQLCLTTSNVTQLPIDLSKSTVTVKIPEITKINEVAVGTFKLTPALTNNKPTKRAYEVTADMKSLHNGAITKCDTVKQDINNYSIQYTPTIRGRHELTIFVDGRQVPGSPFSVFISISPTQLGKPVQVWNGIAKACAITVNSDGDILATEYEGGILKFDREGNRQTLVRKSQHDLKRLRGIAVDSDDNVYCTDEDSNKVLKCDKNGGNIQVHEVKPETGCGHRGVEVVGDEVMICEATRSGTIGVYNRDLMYVRFIKLEGEREFHDISADSDQNLYVADKHKGNITVFKNDGIYLFLFCNDNNGEKKVGCPVGVHVSYQHVFVTDYNPETVSVFTTNGEYVTQICSSGEGEGQVKDSFSVCVDKDGFVYVADRRMNRIQCF